MTITTRMKRGGVVLDHFGIGSLRLRVHARVLRPRGMDEGGGGPGMYVLAPMLYVDWGLRGKGSHRFKLGDY